MKKIIALLLVLVLTLGCFAACKKGDSDKTVVTIVVAGQFGDRSFYDQSKLGGERLAKDFADQVEVKYIECNNEGWTMQMKNAADKSNIVICVGYEFEEIEKVAPDYPDVNFIWIDNATYEPIKNLLNITYAQNEGSFLAGYIAAAMSKTGTVGAVGGADDITINDFIVGYKQGAEYYDPSIKVEINYANSWDDPAKGKDCANVLHDRGADVIFQVASKAGDGVFEAAQEGGFYAIGVDSDRNTSTTTSSSARCRKKSGSRSMTRSRNSFRATSLSSARPGSPICPTAISESATAKQAQSSKSRTT